MVYQVIRGCSTLTQKEYKSRYDWVEKVIHRELCKRLKFDHINKWYMHKPESLLKMRHIKSFETWMYNRITQSQPEGQNSCKLRKRRTCHLVDLTVPTDNRINMKESNNIKDTLILSEVKRLRNMKVTLIPIIVWELDAVLSDLEKELVEAKINEKIDTIRTTAFFLDRLEYSAESW